MHSNSTLLVLLVVALAFCVRPSHATEYQQAENVAAESAEEAAIGMADMDERPARFQRLQLLRDVLQEAPPFWSGASLELGLRMYDFRRDNGVETVSEALAAGTELSFSSGKWRDRLSVGASWHTSNGINAPPDRGGTGLLGPGQTDLSVISRAWLDVKLGQAISARLYRQDFNIPYINRQDSRMIPNTHEAYVLRDSHVPLQWIAGHITKMKRRNSEEFIPMGEIAGADGDESGTTLAGARYEFSPGATIGAILQHTGDLFTTAYSETTFRRTLTEDWGLQLGAQLTNQWSNGDEKLGNFSTYTWGLRSLVSFRGAILTLGYTDTGSAAIRKPFGGTPGFTSSMLFDFDRANETAVRIGLSHNFVRLGMPGTSVIVNYTRGSGARLNDGTPQPDADEIAITADFRPERGLLKGLWLRVRYAEADRGADTTDRQEIRVILNYSLGALQ